MTKMHYLLFYIIFYLLQTTDLSYGQSKSSSPPAYAFIVGLQDDYRVETYYLSDDGTISLHSEYNLFSHRTKAIDPGDAIFSPKGDYIVFQDWGGLNGSFCSVNKDLDLDFIREDNGGFGGLGFTSDGKYFFTSTGFATYPYRPGISIYKVNNGSFDLIRSQGIATTTTLTGRICCSSADEIMGPNQNESYFVSNGFSVYQFDRSTESLTLKQFLKLQYNAFLNDATPDCSVVVHAEGRNFVSIARQPDGSYKEMANLYKDDWWYAFGAWGIRITKDGKYAVGILPNPYNDDALKGNGGAVLFAVKPNGELEYLSIAPRYMATSIDMTPDGKYFVIGHDYGRKLGTFRINKEKGILEEIATYQHDLSMPVVYFLRFFPQVRPATPVSEKTWPLYGKADSKTSPPQIIAQTPAARVRK